jgi:hypothetical protein
MDRSIETVDLVKQVYALGASLRVRDGKVQLQGIEYLPSELIHTLRTHKEEVRSFLEANILRKEDGEGGNVLIPPIGSEGEVPVQQKSSSTNPVPEKAKEERLSRVEVSLLREGLEVLEERIEEDIGSLERDIEDLKERIAYSSATEYTWLIPKAEMAEGELKYITKGKYERLTGHPPRPSILTRDGKRVHWEYALDELASQLGYEERAVHESKSSDDLLRGDIMKADEDKRKLRGIKQQIKNDEGRLGIVEELREKLDRGYGTEVTLKTFSLAFQAGTESHQRCQRNGVNDELG